MSFISPFTGGNGVEHAVFGGVLVAAGALLITRRRRSAA
jgi:LPXTG-motif cell wall-anchored protein